jgi:hypothetical protein
VRVVVCLSRFLLLGDETDVALRLYSSRFGREDRKRVFRGPNGTWTTCRKESRDVDSNDRSVSRRNPQGKYVVKFPEQSRLTNRAQQQFDPNKPLRKEA